MSAVDFSAWDHKEEWRKYGSDFLVVVSRHLEGPSRIEPDKGPNRWAVYAYIYPLHAHFAAFAGSDMWQAAAKALPLHCGPSMLRWHYASDGSKTAVQVGADYQHLHDDWTHCDTPALAWDVFRDAEDLHAWLTAANTAEHGTVGAES